MKSTTSPNNGALQQSPQHRYHSSDHQPHHHFNFDSDTVAPSAGRKHPGNHHESSSPSFIPGSDSDNNSICFSDDDAKHNNNHLNYNNNNNNIHGLGSVCGKSINSVPSVNQHSHTTTGNAIRVSDNNDISDEVYYHPATTQVQDSTNYDYAVIEDRFYQTHQHHHPFRFSSVGIHGHEMDDKGDEEEEKQRRAHNSDPPIASIEVPPSSSSQQTSKSDSRRKFINIIRRNTSRVKALRCNDVRFKRPRDLPSLSRWDPRNPDGPKLLHPVLNPSWLERFQRKLPWYQVTADSGGGPWLSLRTWDAPYQWFWDELKYRWDSPGDRSWFVVRLIGISIMILIFLLMNCLEVGVFYAEKNHVSAIWDWFHQITIPMNEWVHRSEAAYSVFMFFAGFLMDILFLWIFFQWMIMGDSIRLPLAYGLLYALRAVQRFYTILPYAPGYKWVHPQFGSVKWPSLAVPYITGDDFFFSGHVGCGTLAVVEHFYLRNWWGFGFSIFVTIYEAFWLTVTRGHYMLDMFTGAIVASWAHMIAQMLCRVIDQWIAIPPRPIVPRGYARLSMKRQQLPSPSPCSDNDLSTADNDDIMMKSPSTSTGNNNSQDNDKSPSLPLSPVSEDAVSAWTPRTPSSTDGLELQGANTPTNDRSNKNVTHHINLHTDWEDK